MTITPAAEALRKYLDESDRSQSELAATLGIKQPSVSVWLRGQARPEPHLREAIEILTGIPQHAWDTTEERAVVERIRARETDPNTVADNARPSVTP